jgi:hypothetical protein
MDYWNKNKEIKDLKNIVKYFIEKEGGEYTFNPDKLDNMKDYDMLEFRTMRSFDRVIKLVKASDRYDNKFIEWK